METTRKYWFFSVIGMLMMLSLVDSCSLFSPLTGRFDLQVHAKNPVILIPGIMGSSLINPETHEVVWGKILDLKAVDPHQALLFPDKDGVELPVDSLHADGLIAANVLSRFQMLNRIGSVTVYEDLIRTFSKCGLVEGDIQQCSESDNLYLFSYDWRQDLVQTAQLLAQRIKSIKQVSGPETRVTIIAHSMGGLIAQYYLMYGDQDVLADSIYLPDYSGVPNVEKVFFLGTPFGGSPMAFKSLHEGEWIGPGLTISNWATFTMPSIYEMLPFHSPDIFVNSDHEPLALDLTSVNTWLKNGFSIFKPARWQAFQQTCQISFPESGPQLAHSLSQEYQHFFQSALDRGFAFQSALREINWDQISSQIYLVNGSCQETLKQIRLISNPLESEASMVKSRFWNEHYWISDPGDGTVLTSAADRVIPAADKVLKGCYRHRAMPNQPDVIQFILENL